MSSDTGTVLALDFGARYVGVAVGDAAVRVAHPLATIDARDTKSRFDAIGRIIAEWRPARLVVGLPLGLGGDPHAVSRRAQRFARQLTGRFGLPVTLVDERLTSAEAAERLRTLGRGGRQNKRLEHPVAAQVILEDYFANDATA